MLYAAVRRCTNVETQSSLPELCSIFAIIFTPLPPGAYKPMPIDKSKTVAICCDAANGGAFNVHTVCPGQLGPVLQLTAKLA